VVVPDQRDVLVGLNGVGTPFVEFLLREGISEIGERDVGGIEKRERVAQRRGEPPERRGVPGGPQAVEPAGQFVGRLDLNGMKQVVVAGRRAILLPIVGKGPSPVMLGLFLSFRFGEPIVVDPLLEVFTPVADGGTPQERREKGDREVVQGTMTPPEMGEEGDIGEIKVVARLDGVVELQGEALFPVVDDAEVESGSHQSPEGGQQVSPHSPPRGGGGEVGLLCGVVAGVTRHDAVEFIEEAARRQPVTGEELETERRFDGRYRRKVERSAQKSGSIRSGGIPAASSCDRSRSSFRTAPVRACRLSTVVSFSHVMASGS